MKNATRKGMTKADIRQILVITGLSLGVTMFCVAANLFTIIEMINAGKWAKVVGWQCLVFGIQASLLQFVYVYSEPLPPDQIKA